MRLPLLDAEAQMAAKPGSWSLATHCSADDFKLTLSPSIADSVFRLIDMYRQGKAHISQLEKQYLAGAARGEGSDSVVAKYLQQTPVPTRRTQQILVRMSFTFNSGVVELSRLTSEADGDSPKKRSRPDVLVLPSISLWVDYTGPRNESPKDGEDGVIILNAVSSSCSVAPHWLISRLSTPAATSCAPPSYHSSLNWSTGSKTTTSAQHLHKR